MNDLSVGQVQKINVCYWREKVPGTYSISRCFPCFIQLPSEMEKTDIYGLPSNEYPGLMKVSDLLISASLQVSGNARLPVTSRFVPTC